MHYPMDSFLTFTASVHCILSTMYSVYVHVLVPVSALLVGVSTLVITVQMLLYTLVVWTKR